MRAVVTDKRPCKLGRGEMRRVPQDRSFRGLVGYHLGCPRCGFVNAVLQGADGITISEGEDESVSCSAPVRCVFCNVWLQLVAGELTLEEDDDVRPVRYR